MNVIVACEKSGRVREAFRRRGHNAWSCDTEPCEDGSPYHMRVDIREVLWLGRWDLMICHPPCTYLALCQTWRVNRCKLRQRERDAAVTFARMLWESGIPKICMENPKSQLSTLLAPKSQTIHPWQFGHPEFKETWLWLKGLPPLQPTSVIARPERGSEEFKRWERIFRMGRSPQRSAERSRTYSGIAEAMAQQWG